MEVDPVVATDEGETSESKDIESSKDEVVSMESEEVLEVAKEGAEMDASMDTDVPKGADDVTDTAEATDLGNKTTELVCVDEAPISQVEDDSADPISTKTEIEENSSEATEAMEGSTQTDFIDTAQNLATNLPEMLDTDPIAEKEAKEEKIEIEDELVDVEEKTKEESNEEILSVDEKSDKYTVTRCNKVGSLICCMCELKAIPKYLAQKEVEVLYICTEDCLSSFKLKYVGKYVQKMLQLRAFATDKDSGELEFDDENDKSNNPPPSSPPIQALLRKCGLCKNAIDTDAYISWEAIDYCNEACLLLFQKTINRMCAKCKKTVHETLIGKFCVRFGNVTTQFCSTNCLLAYKTWYKFCAYCQEDLRDARYEQKSFCSKRCYEICNPEEKQVEMNDCDVCHKHNSIEIKIRTSHKTDFICSEPCFVAYKFVNKLNPVKCESCPTYFEPKTDDPIVYNEGIPRMICSKMCQKIYLIANRKIVTCCNCAVKKYDFDMIKMCEDNKDVAFACCKTCLQEHLDKKYREFAKKVGEVNITQLETACKDMDLTMEGKNLNDIIKMMHRSGKIPVHKITIVRPPPYVKQRNVATMCKPNLLTKAVTCKPKETCSYTQTDLANKFVIPIPVPIYVPIPLHMYVQPVPMPTPIPIPVPVPIFIPTSRKSINGISKEIKKIQKRVPADPLEAEILMMAEMAAGEKKDESTSESEFEDEPITKIEEPFQNERKFEAEDEPPPTESTFGEDVLTMALKMASDFEEPFDLEGVVAPSTIIPQAQDVQEVKKRGGRGRPRKTSLAATSPVVQPVVGVEIEKPDAHLCLKYTFGVNAWKQWVTIKNVELQKSGKHPKLFKNELLQLTADDLNYSLCLFVKEVRKPSGAEYAPDTIYYLCLGIQQYLYENGRIDNIFCDSFYEKFTDTFNDVCQKFANLYNDSQYIVTRVEEEHLWESKQLGAHSPLVLLNTLMFFNTKHFSLTSVDEHLQLSFSHIMKHWKRNPNVPGARNVLLRFYPPQTPENVGKKRKVYEQQENDDNPLRCPVKLYEFYLLKCPESVKTRNDVFYLQPERSCVPDSPVWYSTMALGQEPLEKMLNRVKMVKEINVALLTS